MRGRVYAVGHSNGAFMVYRLGHELSARTAAVARRPEGHRWPRTSVGGLEACDVIWSFFRSLPARPR